MSFDLKLHAYRLLMDEPFFAALSRKIEKRADYNIPTAGVRVDPDSAQFEMIYNPDFFASLPEEHVRGVLKHEFYHLIFEHVTSRKPEGVPHKAWNIAADLAINSHLQGELPEMACMPGVGPFEDLPLHKSAEWYLANLPQKDEGDEGGSGSGEGGEGDGEGEPGSFDDHSGWDDNADSPQQQAANQMAKERLKNAMKEAAKEAAQSAKGWGSISGAVKEDILKRLESKVDWRKVSGTSSRPASVPVVDPVSSGSTSGMPTFIPARRFSARQRLPSLSTSPALSAMICCQPSSEN